MLDSFDSIPIIVTSNTKIKCSAKGYYEYNGFSKPVINEQFTTEMEHNKVAEKYAVCVKKNNITLSIQDLN